MVAGGLPTIQVLLDDGTGSFPYDITAYARLADGIRISRGRDDEQSEVTAGQCTLVLDNADGRFTLGSTTIASPSPIAVDNRIRVKYTANATAFNRHTGYMNSLPVNWPTGGDTEARVSVTCVDAQARAERRVLDTFVMEEAIEAGPTYLYPLSEPAGSTTAADASGNGGPLLQQAGSGSRVTFGVAGPAGLGSMTAASFSGGKYLIGTMPYAPPVALTFSRSSAPASAECLFSAFGCALVLETSGKLSAYRAGSLAVQTSGSVCDGQFHNVDIVGYLGAGACNVDGSSIGTWGPTGIVPASVTPIAFGSSIYGGLTTANFTGTMSFLVVGFDGASYSEIVNGMPSEASDVRLTRLAGYGGLPLGTLDAGLSTIPAQDTAGSSLWDAIQQVVDAEVGLAYINGSGTLDFHNRNRGPLKTSPDATFDANYLAEDTAFQVDTQGLINYFETTSSATGVTQVVRNATSEVGDGTATHPGHGRYPASATYLVSTDAEALDRANWIVANHAEPAPRLGTLTLDLLTMTAAQQAAALALEPNSWVRITGLPSQTPGGTTADFVVQGLADTLTLSQNAASWTLQLNVVSRSLFTAWILGDSTYGVLDSTTKLYV